MSNTTATQLEELARQMRQATKQRDRKQIGFAIGRILQEMALAA